jgi:hypothetical protein
MSLIEQIMGYNRIIKELEHSAKPFDKDRLKYCIARREKLLHELVKVVDKELENVK